MSQLQAPRSWAVCVREATTPLAEGVGSYTVRRREQGSFRVRSVKGLQLEEDA